jgi:hypothetical protein
MYRDIDVYKWHHTLTTVIISSSGILAVMVDSDWNRENPATEYDHRITAFTFQTFPEFPQRIRPVHFHLEYAVL